MRIQKNLNDLTERYESDDDDESDKHLEARDRRYSCLKFQILFQKSTAFQSHFALSYVHGAKNA